MLAVSVRPGFRALNWLRLARRAVDPRDLLAEHLLDCLERLDVFRRHQHGGEALASRPAGAPDAVDIIFGMDRHVVVEDVADIGDIEPARRYVAGC